MQTEIATAVDGNGDLIEENKSRWLIKPNDSSERSRTIDFVLNNHQEARRRSVIAMNRIEMFYSLSTMIESWKKLLGSP